MPIGGKDIWPADAEAELSWHDSSVALRHLAGHLDGIAVRGDLNKDLVAPASAQSAQANAVRGPAIRASSCGGAVRSRARCSGAGNGGRPMVGQALRPRHAASAARRDFDEDRGAGASRQSRGPQGFDDSEGRQWRRHAGRSHGHVGRRHAWQSPGRAGQRGRDVYAAARWCRGVSDRGRILQQRCAGRARVWLAGLAGPSTSRAAAPHRPGWWEVSPEAGA